MIPPPELWLHQTPPAIVETSSASVEYDNPALAQAFESRSRWSSLVLAPREPLVELVRDATAYVRAVAVLPYDDEAEAEFVKYEQKMARQIPRRVLIPRK